MANLPKEEGLNPQSDVTLPLIEDLPFDSDINLEEADLKFLEEYSDLFDSVDVEDMGLQTLIQSAEEKDVTVNNQTNSLSEAEPESFLAQASESEVEHNELVWLQEDDENKESDDYLDWQAQTEDNVDSTLDLSWEEEPIVDQTTEEAQEESIFDEVVEEPIVDEVVEEIEQEVITDQTTVQLEEEMIFDEVVEEPIVDEEIQQDQNVDSLMDELETFLQTEEEAEQQEPIESPTLDELETLLQYDQEAEELEQQEPIELPTIDELETLLQYDQELEDNQAGFDNNDNEIDQLETLLQIDEDYKEEETNLPEPLPIPDKLGTIQQKEESIYSDPAVDELITLLQNEDSPLQNVESEEEAMIDWEAEDEQPYSVELASMWDIPEEEGVGGLLGGIQEKTIELESQYEWEDAEQVSTEEEYEYYNEQSEDQYDSDLNYEEDEDNSIDQIMTAFQKNDNDEGEEDEIYDESEIEYQFQEEYEQNYENVTEEGEIGTMNNNSEQQVDWEASYNEYQESEEDDYDEWQQGLSNNEFEVEVDDEESAIDEIITTFQFGQDNPSTQVVLDEEADAMVTKWQQAEKDKEEDYSLSDSGMIDWEKIASSNLSSLDIPQPDFESFTIGNDPMETAIRAKNVLEKSKSSLKESVNFEVEDEDMSLPPLPPIRQTRTEINPSPSIALPNFADEYYEEERYQPRSTPSKTNISSKRNDGIVLEDDSDLPYRSQLQSKGKNNFSDVDDDDWVDLLEDIPPVPEEMFGISEHTAARYANTGAPSQFTDSFQSGDTQPANLHSANSFPSQSVSQTAPTFPETPPTSVRVQQFFENNGRAILQITKSIGLIVIPIGLLWGIFSIPQVNKATTITGLRLGIWKDMRGRNLRSIVLKGKNLSGVNFTGADLSGADLSEVNLRGAKLNGAKLEKTNLTGAKLNLADFTDANLRGANLSKSEISKTIFKGADLSSAKFSNRSWAKDNPPITDNKTKCPSGKMGRCSL